MINTLFQPLPPWSHAWHRGGRCCVSIQQANRLNLEATNIKKNKQTNKQTKTNNETVEQTHTDTWSSESSDKTRKKKITIMLFNVNCLIIIFSYKLSEKRCFLMFGHWSVFVYCFVFFVCIFLGNSLSPPLSLNFFLPLLDHSFLSIPKDCNVVKLDDIQRKKIKKKWRK